MKKSTYPIRSRIKPLGGNYRNKFSVFLVCSAISFLLWGLIKLSRVYEAPINFKVNYQHYPAGKVLVSAEDTVITLVIRARGLELYNMMFKAKKNQIEMNLSGMRLRRDGNRYSGYICTSQLVKNISEQLTKDNVLIKVEPDTLRFVFEQEYHRKVPVKADLSLSFIPQFQLYDSLKVEPDSVTIYGVKSIVDTTYVINTQQKSVRFLKGNKSINLELLKPEGKPTLKISTDSVTVKIAVERFTEADIEVPIGLETKGERAAYRTFPDKVTLTCRVAIREYKRLDPSLFLVAINYQEAAASHSNLAEVYITRQPAFAKVIRIEPEKVEFLILK